MTTLMICGERTARTRSQRSVSSGSISETMIGLLLLFVFGLCHGRRPLKSPGQAVSSFGSGLERDFCLGYTEDRSPWPRWLGGRFRRIVFWVRCGLRHSLRPCRRSRRTMGAQLDRASGIRLVINNLLVVQYAGLRGGQTGGGSEPWLSVR